MAGHGGKREGAGRKPKADELQLIEELDRHIQPNEVFDKLHGLIKENNFNAIKLYFEYRFGKPKETVKNINHNISKEELTEEEAKILKKEILSDY